MTTIGNDIVAMYSIDKTRTKEPRFYQKILSTSEQALFPKQPYPLDVFVWLLWSIKESVYKCQKRLSPHLLFSPVRIIVNQLSLSQKNKPAFLNNEYECCGFENVNCSGEVAFGSSVFYFKSIITDEFIYTVASPINEFKHIFCGVKFVDNLLHSKQSDEVKRFSLKKLYGLFPETTALEINKTDIGYPVIFKNGQLQNIPLSFSHSQSFISYSFELRK